MRPPLRILKCDLVDCEPTLLCGHAPLANESRSVVGLDSLVLGFRLDRGGDAFFQGERARERENLDHLVREVQGVLCSSLPFHFHFPSLPFRAENFRRIRERLRSFPERPDFARSGMANSLMFQEVNDVPVLTAVASAERFY